MKMECFLKIKPHNSVRNRTVNFRGNNLFTVIKELAVWKRVKLNKYE